MHSVQAVQAKEEAVQVNAPVMPERPHNPSTYLRAAYLDIAYILSQFSDHELKESGVTPKLHEAMNEFTVAYVVASINFDEQLGDAV